MIAFVFLIDKGGRKGRVEPFSKPPSSVTSLEDVGCEWFRLPAVDLEMEMGLF